MFADFGSQWLDGASYAVAQPLALLAILAAVLLCQPLGRRELLVGLAGVAAGLALAIAWMPGRFASAGAAIILAAAGASLATAWKPRALRAVLLVATGLAAGWSAQLGLASPAEIIGSVFALLGLQCIAAAVLGPTWPRLPPATAALAVRVVGSWIAAVGVLLVALWASGRAV